MEQTSNLSGVKKYCMGCPHLITWISLREIGEKCNVVGDDVMCRINCYCGEYTWDKENLEHALGWSDVGIRKDDIENALVCSIVEIEAFQFKFYDANDKWQKFAKYVEKSLADGANLRELDDKECCLYVERNIEDWSE